jgi:hypothetical protein
VAGLTLLSIRFGVVCGEAGCSWRWSEAGGVWCGLRAELSEVEIGAGFVPEVHGFPQLVFAVEAIEDDGVDSDGDYFHDDFDEAADEGPVLPMLV